MELVALLLAAYVGWGIFLSWLMYVTKTWLFGSRKDRHALVFVFGVFFWIPIVIATIAATGIDVVIKCLKKSR